MGSMSVSSCRYCMFVSCVHSVAFLNVAFCMTCRLRMQEATMWKRHTPEPVSATSLKAPLCIGYIDFKKDFKKETTTEDCRPDQHSISEL